MVMAAGAEGIGLFRTEFLYLNRRYYPTEREQYEKYAEVARAAKPHSVIIRTLDIGGDKFRNEDMTPPEVNPFLGFRGIRFCLANLEIFEAQLRAILRASAEGNVRMMYPMISGVAEVVQANEILQQVMHDLKKEGVPFDEQIQVGAMIEIPSAALTAEMIAPEVDFFSIGSNDLIQYTMAVDRVNEKVAGLYEPTHPAILRLIRGVVEAGHNNGIWVGVCGEMAGEPLFTPLLLGMGIDELSAASSSLPGVKELIRRLTLREAQELAAASLHTNSGREVLAMLNALLQRVDPDLLRIISHETVNTGQPGYATRLYPLTKSKAKPLHSKSPEAARSNTYWPRPTASRHSKRFLSSRTRSLRAISKCGARTIASGIRVARQSPSSTTTRPMIPTSSARLATPNS